MTEGKFSIRTPEERLSALEARVRVAPDSLKAERQAELDQAANEVREKRKGVVQEAARSKAPTELTVEERIGGKVSPITPKVR